MKIVLDTTVVLTAFFFGGPSRQIIESVARGRTAAYATREIAAEYKAAVARMASKKAGGLRPNLLLPFTTRLHMIETTPKPALCRHPGDDRFLSCALDAKAYYIVIGFKELYLRNQGKRVPMMTAEGFSQLLRLYES